MTLPSAYRSRYVSFIDILGFANKVAKIEQDHAIFDQLIDIHSVIEKAADEAKRTGAALDISDVQWAAFSDTIVILLCHKMTTRGRRFDSRPQDVVRWGRANHGFGRLSSGFRTR
jgi:hypothetical protein